MCVLPITESARSAKERGMSVRRIPTIIVISLTVLMAVNCVRAALALVSGYALGISQGLNSIQWTTEPVCYRNGEPIDCSEVPAVTHAAATASPSS
jgi:hypothetical protein